MATGQTTYIQHCDPDILIPQHISRRALISATFFLYVSIVAYVLDYPVTCVLLGSVYITTLLHWNAVKYIGTIKIVDSALATTIILKLTFVDRYRWCTKFHQYWMYVFYILVCGFATNEYLLYMQVTRFSNKVVYTKSLYTIWPLTLLNYTNPNTYKRERAYYRSTYTHMFFIHIFPTTISAMFATISYQQCNWPCIGDNYSE